MKVLIGCECSGIVREAFAARGHDAWSCDVKPTERPGQHLQTDLLTVLDEGWDLMIAHPECTYLCSSGLHWNHRTPGRQAKTDEALKFVRTLLACRIPRVAIENPVGCIGTQIRKSDQMIQPYQFGEDASKGTCLWLRNLPLLQPTRYVAPRMVGGKPRWGNQTDGGQNKLGPSPTRSADRARTYKGIAVAMAEQWGSPAVVVPVTQQLVLFGA